MKYMALDPGGTTGWVFYDSYLDIWEVGQIGPHEHHQTLWRLLEDYKPNIIIDERFEYQRRDLEKGVSLVLISREYIGVAKLWCAMHARQHILHQVAYKRFFDDNKLKLMGRFLPGCKHANDAMRHMLYHLVITEGHKEFLVKPE